MSSSNAEEQVIYQIMNAPMREYPFAHIFVENIFPEDFYDKMLANLPALSAYQSIGETGNVTAADYKERYITDIPGIKNRGATAEQVAFWESLQKWMLSERFLKTLLQKFSASMRERFNKNVMFKFIPDLRLVRDFHNYAIGPHTDQIGKVLSLLFYLPRNHDFTHLGTSIYQHKDPSYSFLGGRHHNFEDFNRLFTAPYNPNSCLMFFKTAKSFHGVEPIQDENVERNVMLYNIYCDPVPEKI